MTETSELIEFRRAFAWLLCGMLLPSVALVAFGVVAVTNERAAVERRLNDEYDARLRALAQELQNRLDGAAQAVAQGRADPLASNVRSADTPAEEPALADAIRRVGPGEHLFVSSDGEIRRAYAVVRTRSPVPRPLLAQLDLRAIALQVPELAHARFPRDRAAYRLVPPREPAAGFAALRRMVSDASPASANATLIARVPLPPPLDGFLLGAELAGDDPAAALAFRNRTLYIALLILLYVGIGLGFGLTIREMRRAYRLSRLKTDFVANISHELRTPLTSVRLFAETLRDGRAESPEEVRECLELLSGEAQRLSGLVERLLDWSRLESGRRPLRKEKVAINALFAQIDDAFRAQQLPARYQQHIEPGLPELSIDREAMAQAVLNLLHNAVKYTGHDKRIRLTGRSLPGAVAIEVEDNGVGVKPQDRKRIFERFYRADNLLSRHTDGSGLGLPIAKKIAEAHGGRIEMESKPGEGSLFRIVVPVS